MAQEEAFLNVLDSDEKIVESFKPHKTRYILFGIISDFLKSLIFDAFGIITLLITSLDFTDESGEEVSTLGGQIIGWCILGIGILIFLIAVVWRLVSYKKTWYCYTNKRILIRSGFIGADYQMLDFDMIGAMNVRVDLLDKLFKSNTGTITFASAASPMITAQQGRGYSGYAFECVDHPYELYKRIKEFSSKNRDGNPNS